MNVSAVTTGIYTDASNVYHSFLRAAGGTITPFDAPDAGTDPGQGTIASDINPAGVIAGHYFDPDSLSHGFVRAPDGTITSFDAGSTMIPWP